MKNKEDILLNAVTKEPQTTYAIHKKVFDYFSSWASVDRILKELVIRNKIKRKKVFKLNTKKTFYWID